MRLDVRFEAVNAPIGVLESTPSGAVAFAYEPRYLADPAAIPISLSLPLENTPFDDPATRDFFDNLLPENDQLRDVMERERIPRDDVVGLLHRLGADCPGAISCLPEGSPPQKVPGNIATDYDALDPESLCEIARRLADRESPLERGRDPSPLAGVQRKIALTSLGDGVFGLPKQGSKAPTTHILKVPAHARMREARLEEAASALAGSCLDMPVAVAHCIDFKGVSGLISERFDRVASGGGVRRIHQEDFAQALGLSARLKYERGGVEGRRYDASAVARMMDRLAFPARAKRDFLLATIFNFVVGNTDNHAKNHALLYDRGAAPSLAPLYDILPILIDPSVTHDLSMRIGSAVRGEDVTRADVERLLAIFGFTQTSARRRFLEGEVRPLLETIEQASDGLVAIGLKDIDDLIGRQIGLLNHTLSLGMTIRERDYFAARGGGWGLGS